MKNEIICLQDKTGSCLGCNILLLASKRLNEHGTCRDKGQLNTVAQYIQGTYCPAGRVLQTESIKPENSSIW